MHPMNRIAGQSAAGMHTITTDLVFPCLSPDYFIESIPAWLWRAGAAASEALQQQFSLSKEQAEGVLNMSLRRLTSLEANRLQEESQQLNAR